MSISIDPSRRSGPIRRARKSAAEIVDDLEAGRDPDAANLPVPAGPAKTLPSGAARGASDAAIHAQVLGEKRGLRAGPTIHDQAKATYNQTKWSGAQDRRAPKGRAAKTEV
ncbi:MAG TPA: hypothetical protein VGC92_15875 [Phenylobacterium sp.]|jgi:hypothetical protein